MRAWQIISFSGCLGLVACGGESTTVGAKNPVVLTLEPAKWATLTFVYANKGTKPLPWTTAVVLVGDRQHVTAQAYPSGNAEDFDFPEKKWLKGKP